MVYGVLLLVVVVMVGVLIIWGKRYATINKTVMIIGIVGLGVWLGGYGYLGAHQSWQRYRQVVYIDEQILHVMQQPDVSLSLQLTWWQQRVAVAPCSGYGWYYLGIVYLQMGEFALAYDALLQAEEYEPQQAEVVIALAEAYYFVHNQQVDDVLRGYVRRAQGLQPLLVKVQFMQGLLAFHDGAWQEAMRVWARLINESEVGGMQREVLEAFVGMIGE